MRQSLGENPTVTSAMDPFLSNTVTTSASQQQQQQQQAATAAAAALAAQQQQQQQQQQQHNREESTDSGVGMGSNLHLVSIPEDLPVDMDTNDLDTTLTNEKPPVAAAAAAAAAATATAATAPSSSMDTSRGPGEDLLPSLPAELGETLPDNIMQDVATQGLTWL